LGEEDVDIFGEALDGEGGVVVRVAEAAEIGSDDAADSGEIVDLRVPDAVIEGESMEKDERDSVTGFLVEEGRAVDVEMGHAVS
jgi:hypothetical protein